MHSSSIAAALSACLLAVWLPRWAVAQSVDPETLERASHLFDRGVECAQEGGYEQAVIAFEQAYALSGSTAVLYNLGMAYVAAGRPVEASDTLRRYLEHDGQALPAAERERIAQELTQQEGRVGTLTMTVEPPSARISIDGRALAAEVQNRPARLAVGDHWLEISAPGYELRSIAFSVTAGAQGLSLRLRESDRRPRAVPPAPIVHRAEERPSQQALQRAGYGTGALGLAAELAAFTVYLVGDARYNSWSKTDRELRVEKTALIPNGSDDQIEAFNTKLRANNGRWRRVERFDKAALGLAIGGAGLLVAGIALVAWPSLDKERKLGSRISLRVDRLGVSGTF